jgi:hypothetical protein
MKSVNEMLNMLDCKHKFPRVVFGAQVTPGHKILKVTAKETRIKNFLDFNLDTSLARQWRRGWRTRLAGNAGWSIGVEKRDMKDRMDVERVRKLKAIRDWANALLNGKGPQTLVVEFARRAGRRNVDRAEPDQLSDFILDGAVTTIVIVDSLSLGLF